MHYFKYPEVLELAKTIEEDNPEELIVPKRLNKAHPLITKFKDNSESYSEFRTDIIRLTSGVNNLRIEVTKFTLKRALIFFNAFINLAKARGHEVTIKDNKTLIIITGRDLKLRLREPNKVHDRKDKHGWNERSYSASGELTFMLESFYTEKEWRDTKNVKLENKLAVIMAFLELKAKEEIRQKEESRIREEIKKREEELQSYQQQLIDKDTDKYLKLINEAQRWSKYTELKVYLDQIKSEDTKTQEWLNWAYNKLNWLDPRNDQVDELLGDYLSFEEKYVHSKVEKNRSYYAW